jgi:membrane dipeptidase
MAERPENRLLIARTTDDIRRAKRENKVAIILSFEGAKTLGGKVENVERYHNQGLRELQLFWAVPNELKTENGRGLSRFGEQVVAEMNRLGIVIDTSHMAAEAFGHVLELSTRPIIISHGAVRALQGGDRVVQASAGDKLSGSDIVDDIGLRALAKNGGVLCLHFVTPDYIKPRHGTPRGSVADWVDHAAYIRDLVGIDHVALGPDYFPERGWHWIDGAGQIALLPKVARDMVRRGQ